MTVKSPEKRYTIHQLVPTATSIKVIFKRLRKIEKIIDYVLYFNFHNGSSLRPPIKTSVSVSFVKQRGSLSLLSTLGYLQNKPNYVFIKENFKNSENKYIEGRGIKVITKNHNYTTINTKTKISLVYETKPINKRKPLHLLK